MAMWRAPSHQNTYNSPDLAETEAPAHDAHRSVQALSALANAARTCGEITSMRRQVEEFCSQSGCRDAPELPTA
eukprot:12737-Heterococcus_DN1.PRE.1